MRDERYTTMTDATVQLAHGSGGKLTYELVKNMFWKRFAGGGVPVELPELNDSAVVEICGGTGGLRLAFTTDSYVVHPLFFPGGDIGKLAVSGTVNDLSVMGAEPLYLSCGFVIEAGLSLATLERIVESMQATATLAGVKIITGDTKVVEKGGADGIFINTSGIGILPAGRHLSRHEIAADDKIIINGTAGDHAIAILTARQELGFTAEVQSDCAPLNGLIGDMLAASSRIKFMRDPTRGGLATVLNEIVMGKDFGIVIEEPAIPIREDVVAICEIVGFDPLYLANEGKVVTVVHPDDAEDLLAVMHNHPLGKDSAIIGEVVAGPRGRVHLLTCASGTRILDMQVGDQLPRIC